MTDHRINMANVGLSIKTDYRDSTRVSIEMSAGLSLEEILDVSTELAALGARVVDHEGDRRAVDRWNWRVAFTIVAGVAGHRYPPSA